MRWVRVGTVDLLECESCDGTWIEAAAFERLCADRDNQSAVLHTKGGEPVPATARPAPIRYRPCPRCGKLMNRMNFARLSGAVVDVCRGHGTFLDKGELHQVVRFILEGGLARTRQAEREALVEEQRRLRDLQREQAHLAPPAGGGAWDERWVRDLLSALFDRGGS
jgi:Zn-finger nucleic acid-binding protein